MQIGLRNLPAIHPRMCKCNREELDGRKKQCRWCAREAKNAYMRDYMKKRQLKLEPQPEVPRQDDGERRISKEADRAVDIMKGV